MLKIPERQLSYENVAYTDAYWALLLHVEAQPDAPVHTQSFLDSLDEAWSDQMAVIEQHRSEIDSYENPTSSAPRKITPQQYAGMIASFNANNPEGGSNDASEEQEFWTKALGLVEANDLITIELINQIESAKNREALTVITKLLFLDLKTGDQERVNEALTKIEALSASDPEVLRRVIDEAVDNEDTLHIPGSILDLYHQAT